MNPKQIPRYQATAHALEVSREAEQRGAIHIALKERNACIIRGNRALINQIVPLADARITYAEIARRLAGEFAAHGVDIPEKYLAPAVSAAYRAEKADSGQVDEMLEKIYRLKKIKDLLIQAVHQRGYGGVLSDPLIKQALIESEILTHETASKYQDKSAREAREERNIFRVAITILYTRWRTWHAARGDALLPENVIHS